MLKSTAGWFNDGNGEDIVGFSALPSGYGGEVFFGDAGRGAYFWSSSDSEDDSQNYASGLFLYYSTPKANMVNFSKDLGGAVRCIKD